MRTFLSAAWGVVELLSNILSIDGMGDLGLSERILLGSLAVLPAACCLAGCLFNSIEEEAGDLVVQESERLRAGT